MKLPLILMAGLLAAAPIGHLTYQTLANDAVTHEKAKESEGAPAVLAPAPRAPPPAHASGRRDAAPDEGVGYRASFELRDARAVAAGGAGAELPTNCIALRSTAREAHLLAGAVAMRWRPGALGAERMELVALAADGGAHRVEGASPMTLDLPAGLALRADAPFELRVRALGEPRVVAQPVELHVGLELTGGAVEAARCG